jgi:hypothetical protein
MAVIEPYCAAVKRMETIDDEILEHTLKWIDRRYQAETAVQHQDQVGGCRFGRDLQPGPVGRIAALGLVSRSLPLSLRPQLAAFMAAE